MPILRPVALMATISLAACTNSPTMQGDPMPTETVRLEPTGELSLRAGVDVLTTGYTFDVGFPEDATNLSAPDSVSWSIGFGDYCRDRPSWVQSVVIGPSGQVWRGYRVAVPPGPDRAQFWSSGGSGADAYGGPATPGLLEAAAQGGRFILAIEDDEGQRWNAFEIDTLSPAGRQRLFEAQPETEAREERMLVIVEAPPPPIRPGSRPCP